MAIPGSAIKRTFRVTNGGAPVLGLTIASFTFNAFEQGVAQAIPSNAITEIANGFYLWEYNNPAAPQTLWDIYIFAVNPAHLIEMPDIQADIEPFDFTTLAGLVRQPVTTVGLDFAPPSDQTIRYVALDTRPIILNIVDQAGDPIDLLNDYSALGFGIRSQDGVTSVTEIPDGRITPTAGGVATVEILVGDNFQSFIQDGQDSVAMRWDFQATRDSDGAIITLARGQFTLLRHEYRS